MKYPVYKRYKDSESPLIGRIPAHWDEKRAKYFFREVDERSTTGNEELLSVSHITGVTPRSEKDVTMFLAESYEGYKTCQPDDLVINIMWAWMGALGVSRHQGIVSSAYGVYRQKRDSLFDSDYLNFLSRIPEYVTEYTRRSTGVHSSRLRMYTDDFFNLPLICPPIEEQKAIARYLDRKLAEIDLFIQNKQRLIQLLKEQKAALIDRAVTKGIDDGVRMKYSGIAWLGEIPAHWTMGRAKTVSSIFVPQRNKPDLNDIAIAVYIRTQLV
jgi:type I restriction enzyme, S subunit